MKKNHYSVWEVVSQSSIKRVDLVDGNFSLGYAPECTLTLKEPGRFTNESLVVKLHGTATLHPFQAGDLVAVSLSYQKANHGNFTEVTVDDIMLVKRLNNLFE